VASDRSVNVELLTVRTSALLPRKPMSVILFRYMSVSPFRTPELTRGMHGEAAGVGPAPKCRRSAFSEGTERNWLGDLCRPWSEFVSGGTETHRARSEAEDRVPQGDGYAPNRCPSKSGNRKEKTHTNRTRHPKIGGTMMLAKLSTGTWFASSTGANRQIPKQWRLAGASECDSGC
jgi:hypothetical protein